MSEPKWTPGPWGIKLAQGSINGAQIWGKGFVTVARITRDADKPRDQKDADARLLAAAPELYEALVNRTEAACKGECDRAIDWHSDACLKARAALAKARGNV